MASRDAMFASLERTYAGSFTARRVLDVGSDRFVVFSDQHKGSGDGADEFNGCVPAYCAALSKYYDDGFNLILMGDVEELWENRIGGVVATHRTAFVAEAKFGASRYLRIRGNHDDRWIESDLVARDLRPNAPVDHVWEAVRFQVVDGGRWLGELLLLHGHQGEFASDVLSPLGRVALRLVWRPLQQVLGIGKETPATHFLLRGKHDRVMYEWATTHPKMILIAGHTHRPVWTSRTHLQKLQEELNALRALALAARPADYDMRLAAKEAAVAERQRKYPPSPEDNDFRPIECYFNTGCCKFSDGDITGIEFERGRLSLVKWSREGDRTVLEEERIQSIFQRLP